MKSAPNSPLLAVALATLHLPAIAQERGAADQPDGTTTSAPSDLAQRSERLRQYLTERRSRLDIVASTKTDSGQILDWIHPGSQVASGRLASPPPLDVMPDYGHRGIRPELEDQEHARGPAGAVPILRRDVEEVLNGNPQRELADFLSKHGRAKDRSTPMGGAGGEIKQPGESDHHYASTCEDVLNQGGHGNISIWDPYVADPNEFSLGQVNVATGPEVPVVQTVEAGWQDYPALYGSNGPHLFVFYTTNGYGKMGDNVGGYNLDVDGFVQYSSITYPGMLLPASKQSGWQVTVHVRVLKYQGNWWIRAGNEWVGYYPCSLFGSNGLRYSAGSIAWYGEVVDLDDGVFTKTDMGSGQPALLGYGLAAFMCNLTTYRYRSGVPFHYQPTKIATPTPLCYSLDDHSLSGGLWGSYFFFGGKGKSFWCKNK